MRVPDRIVASLDPFDVFRATEIVKKYRSYLIRYLIFIENELESEACTSCREYYHSNCSKCISSIDSKVDYLKLTYDILNNVVLVPLFEPRPGYYRVLPDIASQGVAEKGTTIYLGKLACIALRDKRLRRAYEKGLASAYFIAPLDCILKFASKWEKVQNFGVQYMRSPPPRLNKGLQFTSWLTLRYLASKEGSMSLRKLLDLANVKADKLDAALALRNLTEKYYNDALSEANTLRAGHLEKVAEDRIAVFRAVFNAAQLPLMAPIARLVAKQLRKPVILYSETVETMIALAVPPSWSKKACDVAYYLYNRGLMKLVITDCGATIVEGIVEFYGSPTDLASSLDMTMFMATKSSSVTA